MNNCSCTRANKSLPLHRRFSEKEDKILLETSEKADKITIKQLEKADKIIV